MEDMKMFNEHKITRVIWQKLREQALPINGYILEYEYRNENLEAVPYGHFKVLLENEEVPRWVNADEVLYTERLPFGILLTKIPVYEAVLQEQIFDKKVAEKHTNVRLYDKHGSILKEEKNNIAGRRKYPCVCYRVNMGNSDVLVVSI